MGPDTVVAICAVVIAVASLAVSIYEVHATQQHNRRSVRPMLQLDRSWGQGRRAGIRLTNVGLGPAIIVSSSLTVDGEVVGAWNKASVDGLRERLPVRPSAVTFGARQVVATGYEQFLLSVAGYEPEAHAGLAELVNQRLTLEIRYESLYGGENFHAALLPGVW